MKVLCPLRTWVVVFVATAAVFVVGCESMGDAVVTYGAKGAEIQAERVVAQVYGLPTQMYPYGGPEIENPLASIKTRWPKLKPLLDDGTLALTEDGEVTLHDAGTRNKDELRAIRELIRAENRDRYFLYRGVTVGIGHGDQTLQLMIQHTEDVFAEQWYLQAPGGWWIQDSRGNWLQKPGAKAPQQAPQQGPTAKPVPPNSVLKAAPKH